MTEVHDHLIPVSVILGRLEKHLAQMRIELADTPGWRVKRRLVLAGACSAYQYEIEELLRVTASWQPIWTTRPANAHVESPTETRRR